MNINTIKKIDYAIYHNPELIPILMRDSSIKKGLIYSRLKRAVPRRIGIEFECIGNPFYKSRLSNSEEVERLFRVKSYSQDWSFSTDPDQPKSVIGLSGHTSNFNQYDPDLYTPLDQGHVEDSADLYEFVSTPDLSGMNELRVSIMDYHQLIGLKRLLDIFDDTCQIPEGGGIHIHVDYSDCMSANVDKAMRYVRNHLDKVEAIFPKYEGTYNKRKVGYCQKGTYVNFSVHESIEFRIAPLTFNYSTIVKWVVDCTKFVNKMIQECHLKTAKPKYSRSSKPNDRIGIYRTPLANGIVLDRYELAYDPMSNSSYSQIILSEFNRLDRIYRDIP